MTPKTKRLLVILTAGIMLAGAATLGAIALRDNIVFFVTPSQMTEAHQGAKRLRVGGLVAQDSVTIDATITHFTITDQTAELRVKFDGALPDLFRVSFFLSFLAVHGIFCCPQIKLIAIDCG